MEEIVTKQKQSENRMVELVNLNEGPDKNVENDDEYDENDDEDEEKIHRL